MKTRTLTSALRFLAIAAVTSALGGCALFSTSRVASTTNERECLARAMYFESNRSSDDGMLAVGTVVMNRVESGKYPRSICGTVGQRVQFAPGVLTKRMNDSGRERAFRVADQVISGKRYPGMSKNVHFFHTAGYTYPYNNMHYVAVAGGNAFYEKRRRGGDAPYAPPVMVAQAEMPPLPTTVAAAEPMPSPQPRKYSRPAARPLPTVAYQDDAGPQADPVIDILPPTRPRLGPVKRRAEPQVQVAQNDPDAGMMPEALPPVRPRGSIGKAHIGASQADGSHVALPPVRGRSQPQFNFQQGPSGAEAAAPAAKPRRPMVAQSRTVPTIRIQPEAVQADMGGMPEPAPAPKAKRRSSLEPEPLY
ncbi:cell wall hydrolase [Labrys sp. La1]|uniref:cell wall hydrolase n=1 Tax=Labrys sp. La1 TaxID=3404917 RepID=UPI003EBDA53F